MASSEDNHYLSEHYLYELLKGCLTNKKILEMCVEHLKYDFLYTRVQKKVFKFIVDSYKVMNQAPTMGAIGQAYSTDREVIAFLTKVANVKIEGKEDIVINAFENYIKDVRFQRLYYNLAELYKEDKKKEAIELLQKESEIIANFSIKSKMYTEVFAGFDERQQAREHKVSSNENAALMDVMTWGVHEMDRITKGGPRKGTSFLGMAQSGVGKTTFLRWIALCCARLGKKVVLFQGEDTQENSMTAFDAAWTGITIENIEHANIPDDKLDAIMKTRKYIQNAGGKIFIVSSEQFSKMMIEDCNDIIADIVKIEGPIDMALFDYLEIMGTKGNWGNGESAERRRRESVAQAITDIATTWNIVTGTMTQAADVKAEKLDQPDFVLTRSNASEFKGVIKPFAYFFTLNQTTDEYNSETMRIYFDKLRKYKAKQIIKIVQAREHGRFYSAARTLAMVGN